MKNFFYFCAFISLFGAPVFCIPFIFLAIGASPGGYRRDGMRRQGGLLYTFYDWITDSTYGTKYYKYARGFEVYSKLTIIATILILVVIGLNY